MIKREFYLNQILPYMKTDLIKIIVGIRRSGKSTLMKQIIEILSQDGINKEEIIYLNFEDYRLLEISSPSQLDEVYSWFRVDIAEEGKKLLILRACKK